ncbi:hypothetical protein ACR4XJ_01495 [Nitratidesulfovibrio sp. D1]|uniref:hypothetical protein n=1 Tax=Nitratidesulfovibrio sp. D1 TaxID=3440151 RepID=UPI003EBD09B7
MPRPFPLRTSASKPRPWALLLLSVSLFLIAAALFPLFPQSSLFPGIVGVSSALAAEAAPKAVADKPAPNVDRAVQVAVELEGTDSLGARLAFRLKDVFNASSLFVLSEKDAPKIRVLLSTTPEFPSRPAVGSAYSVVWVFSQSEGTLRHYLAREVGVVTAETVEDLVAHIAERTDGISVRYGYLFQ